MKTQVEDDWEGWDGDTIVKLVDGSVWRQAEYFYEYSYAYRPTAILENNKLKVEGMSRAIEVRRID